jgi:hypothetical protein
MAAMEFAQHPLASTMESAGGCAQPQLGLRAAGSLLGSRSRSSLFPAPRAHVPARPCWFSAWLPAMVLALLGDLSAEFSIAVLSAQPWSSTRAAPSPSVVFFLCSRRVQLQLPCVCVFTAPSAVKSQRAVLFPPLLGAPASARPCARVFFSARSFSARRSLLGSRPAALAFGPGHRLPLNHCRINFQLLSRSSPEISSAPAIALNLQLAD